MEYDLYFDLVTEKLFAWLFGFDSQQTGRTSQLAVINPERHSVKDKVVFFQVEFKCLIKKVKLW